MRLAIILTPALATPAHAQTWNAHAGGYNTGYGTVCGSMGFAMATQQICHTMQLNMQRAMARQAFEANPSTASWKNNVAGALAFFCLSTAQIAQARQIASDLLKLVPNLDATKVVLPK